MSEHTTLLRVRVRLEGSWGVGGVGAPGDQASLPILLDPRDGRPYLPGTSLVGAFRAHLGRERAERWFGPQPLGLEVQDESAPAPSPVRVLGTRVTGATAVLDGRTRIDAVRRAADGGSLWVEQRATPDKESTGSLVDWYLQHEGGVDEDLVSALLAWRPTLGRRRSTGQGVAEVSSVCVREVDLATDAGMTWWLGPGRREWLHGTQQPDDQFRTLKEVHAAPPTRTEWQVQAWRIHEPLHVGALNLDEAKPGTRTAVPAKVVTKGSWPYVPATAWKGVIRHRFEYILRAVGTKEEEITLVVRALFGSGPLGSKAKGGPRQPGRPGALIFTDSRVEGARRVNRHHVAIDRVSGGARDGLLFAWEAVVAGTLKRRILIPVETELPRGVAVLMSHVDRDLHDGLLGIGGGVTRGYGWLTLKDRPEPEPLTRVLVEEMVRWATEWLEQRETTAQASLARPEKANGPVALGAEEA